MSKKKNKLVPELRFPEFKNEGEWNIEPLGNLSDEIVEKTNGRKYKLMSITSGVGLVSQIEKFGREIAGDSYKNYYVIHKGDFAYNKSSTKLYAEGEIAMFEENEIGAVPNSIFTCFRFHNSKIYPPFAKYPFINNLHGNWLKRFISVGARVNGALQLNVQDLFSLPFPYPSIQEQQKIAFCLSSLDELITVHCEKLELLKVHKKGLMQKLFPKNGEKAPKCRFKEFEKDGKWLVKKIGDYYKNLSTGMTPSRTNPEFFNGNIPWITSGELNYSIVTKTREYITEVAVKETNLKVYRPGTFFIAITGLEAPGTRGKCAINGIPITTNQSCLAFEENDIIDTKFLFYWYQNFSENLYSYAQGTKQQSFNNSIVEKFILVHPSKKEQQKIASCLSALDEIITAQAELIEQLKLYKKGLMQSLFPKASD